MYFDNFDLLLCPSSSSIPTSCPPLFLLFDSILTAAGAGHIDKGVVPSPETWQPTCTYKSASLFLPQESSTVCHSSINGDDLESPSLSLLEFWMTLPCEGTV